MFSGRWRGGRGALSKEEEGDEIVPQNKSQKNISWRPRQARAEPASTGREEASEEKMLKAVDRLARQTVAGLGGTAMKTCLAYIKNALEKPQQVRRFFGVNWCGCLCLMFIIILVIIFFKGLSKVSFGGGAGAYFVRIFYLLLPLYIMCVSLSLLLSVSCVYNIV